MKAVVSLVAAIATQLQEGGLSAKDAETASQYTYVDALLSGEPISNYPHRTAEQTLLHGFTWSNTLEGGPYWDTLHDKLLDAA